MLLKPVRSVLIQQFLRAAPAAAAGGLLIGAGIYSSSWFLWVFGLAALTWAVVIASNLFFASMRLEGGVLTSTAFLSRRSVRLAEITDIVPFHRTFVWKSVVRDRRAGTPVLDVRTAGGSAGIWLNPEVYGESAILTLLRAIGRDAPALNRPKTIHIVVADAAPQRKPPPKQR